MAKKLPPDVLAFFRKHGKAGGKLGGKMSLKTMTPAERTGRAKRAGVASGAARKAKAKKAAG